MKNKILNISLAYLLSSGLYATELQIGTGTFQMNGGFIGLSEQIDTDISTYSILEQHSNFGSSNWFYAYSANWYDSDSMIQAQQDINAVLNLNPTPLTTPSIDYRLQGLDINMILGRDLAHTSENDYVGLGLMLGISVPWIDSKKDESNDDSTSDIDILQSTKTSISTYKIGPCVKARKSLNDFFTVYWSGTYAYQTGSIKNDYLDSSLSVNGIFQEYDFGIRFQTLFSDYDLGLFTISPRLYATLGYRYTSWDINDVSIDVMGLNNTFSQGDFNMNSSVTYFGLAYTF